MSKRADPAAGMLRVHGHGVTHSRIEVRTAGGWRPVSDYEFHGDEFHERVKNLLDAFRYAVARSRSRGAGKRVKAREKRGR